MRPPVPQPRPPARTDPRRGKGQAPLLGVKRFLCLGDGYPAGSLIPPSLPSPGLAARRLQPGAEAPRPRLPWGSAVGPAGRSVLFPGLSHPLPITTLLRGDGMEGEGERQRAGFVHVCPLISCLFPLFLLFEKLRVRPTLRSVWKEPSNCP